jgi:hypothetical protein
VQVLICMELGFWGPKLYLLPGVLTKLPKAQRGEREREREREREYLQHTYTISPFVSLRVLGIVFVPSLRQLLLSSVACVCGSASTTL